MGLSNSNAHGLIELLYEYTNPYILDDSRFKVAFPISGIPLMISE